jgi:hypothetical protein
MTDESKDVEQIRITDIENNVGNALDISPQERIRHELAVKVLGALAVIFVLAGIGLLACPDNRVEQAQAIFEFVKTAALPIATLVLGFYFRSEGS